MILRTHRSLQKDSREGQTGLLMPVKRGLTTRFKKMNTSGQDACNAPSTSSNEHTVSESQKPHLPRPNYYKNPSTGAKINKRIGNASSPNSRLA